MYIYRPSHKSLEAVPISRKLYGALRTNIFGTRDPTVTSPPSVDSKDVLLVGAPPTISANTGEEFRLCPPRRLQAWDLKIARGSFTTTILRGD